MPVINRLLRWSKKCIWVHFASNKLFLTAPAERNISRRKQKNKNSPNLKVYIVLGLLEKKPLKIFKRNTVFKIAPQKKN
jgi:hypothetical protein